MACVRRHSVIERGIGIRRKGREQMTSETQNDANRPLGGHELDVIHGGFFLMELLVQINQVAIIIGMNVPAPQKVRNA